MTTTQHTNTKGVANALANNPDERIQQQGRRMAAMLEARKQGVTDPAKLRAISRNTR